MLVICRLLACCLILLSATGRTAAQTTSQAYPGDRLAFISGGKLYVGFPRARLVPGPGNACQPAFSYDGQWLAFLRQQWQGYAASSQLWLARADGSAAHAVSSTGGVTIDSFQRSPSENVLAVQPASAQSNPPIRLIPAQGATHAVPNHLSGSYLWSSDGQTLAIAATSRRGYTQLDLVRRLQHKSVLRPRIDQAPLPARRPQPLARLVPVPLSNNAKTREQKSHPMSHRVAITAPLSP